MPVGFLFYKHLLPHDPNWTLSCNLYVMSCLFEVHYDTIANMRGILQLQNKGEDEAYMHNMISSQWLIKVGTIMSTRFTVHLLLNQVIILCACVCVCVCVCIHSHTCIRKHECMKHVTEWKCLCN